MPIIDVDVCVPNKYYCRKQIVSNGFVTFSSLPQAINQQQPKNQDAASGNRGRRVGIAYELENGEIIYVPE